MKTVLFACTHNAGRSQMAAAWFGRLADPTKAIAFSAGTSPGARVHPEVLAVMAEEGFDLTNAVPRLLTDDLATDASLLVTMGVTRPGTSPAAAPRAPPKGTPRSYERARSRRRAASRLVPLPTRPRGIRATV